MAAGVQISISDQATPALKALIKSLERPGSILRIMGREAANGLRRHFKEKDSTHASALGTAAGRRQHFWLSMMRSVTAPVTNPSTGEITVSVTDPRFAQKVFGGTITAKRAKFLTIPIDREAYGRTAVFESEVGQALFFLRSRSDNRAYLATSDGKGSLELRYVLKRSVKQDADPTALPDLKKLGQAIADRAEKWLLRDFPKS